MEFYILTQVNMKFNLVLWGFLVNCRELELTDERKHRILLIDVD